MPFRNKLLESQYSRSAQKAQLIVVVALALFFGVYLLVSSGFSEKKQTALFQTGDIIFQTSQSMQCTAVRIATRSEYSHCGMIYMEKNKAFVYEAIGPVKFTPFNEWIKHGKDSKYVVRRLKDAGTILTPAVLAKMKSAGDKYNGKNYDIYFGWSDENIYCSELVWKIYKEGAGIEVGKLQKLKEFDLSHKKVQAILKDRYGDNIPMEEIVISPQSVFESDLLVTVKDTY